MDNIGLFFLIFNFNGLHPLLDNFMIFVTKYLIYFSFFVALILGFKGKVKEKRSFLLLLASLPFAFLIIKLIHLVFFEPRPFVTFNFPPLVFESPFSPSFPSIHSTMVATTTFSFLFFKSKWTFLFLPLMISVGISRIYVGVHYPLDVIGGFLVALLSIFSAKLLLTFLKIRFFR